MKILTLFTSRVTAHRTVGQVAEKLVHQSGGVYGLEMTCLIPKYLREQIVQRGETDQTVIRDLTRLCSGYFAQHREYCQTLVATGLASNDVEAFIVSRSQPLPTEVAKNWHESEFLAELIMMIHELTDR